MIGPTGKFTAARGFQLEGGHEVRPGDSIDLTDPELIQQLLVAGKLEARDDQTRRRIEWRESAQWAPAPERTSGGYRAVNW